MSDFLDKCSNLMTALEEYTKKDVMVCFSGGVDSSLLLKLACICASKNEKKVYAVTLHTMLHPVHEIESAKKVASEIGAQHMVIQVDELSQAGVMNNPVERCYLCKKYLFEQVLDMASKLGVDIILEGTNEDDLHVYRPGIKALKELGIKSPLADALMSKADVRRLALEYHISVSKKPSTPCLATRFPYGTELTYEKMRMVEQAEIFIKNLGMNNIRVRVHDDIVRIEVDDQDFLTVLNNKKEIINYLKTLGYLYLTLDLEGFRSGSMDILVEGK